jgi:hypothetical protein
MGVVIEICVKHPGGPTRIRGTDISKAIAIVSTVIATGNLKRTTAGSIALLSYG